MKTTKLFNIILACFAFAMVISCVQDDDFDIPEPLTNIEEPVLSGSQVTFKAVKERFEQSGGITTFGENEDIYIVGYVVSNDISGNFFEELIIQNKIDGSSSSEDPRMGLRIDINLSDLHNKYNFGRKIYIKLSGLSVTEDNGVIAIGKIDQNDELGQIEPFELDDIIFRSPEAVDIIPKSTTITNLTSDDLNTLIQLDQVQFSSTALGLTFAGESSDSFDGERIIESCEDGGTIILSSSTFSNFKSVVVPSNSGKINAIYSKNFFGDTDILVISDLDDLDFNSERCDISVPLAPNTTIAEVREMFNGSNVVIPPGEDVIFEGYVISSDREGNFFKNLFIQDLPENPTAAIQILADENSLFQSYPIGAKVLVKLNTLYLGESFGVLSLGYFEDGFVDRIEEGAIGNFVINTGDSETIVPTSAKIISGNATIDLLDESGNPVDEDEDGETDQVPAPEGILLNFDGVQIPTDDIGEAYAYYSGNESANRNIVSCETNSSMILRNSGFSDFANLPFPTGKGNITAILSGYLSTPQLLIRDTNDVNLNEDRCDPVFEETFGSAVDNTVLDLEGWLNFAEAGSALWMEDVYQGNGYARFSAFNSGDSSNIGWLISPSIDLDAQDGEILSFQTEHAFPDSGHDPLDVLISTDFDGSEEGILTATWTPLTFDVSYIVDFGNWYNFTSSGDIDLSGYSGTAYIAFRYTGSDTANQNMTLDVDNILISVP